MKKEFRVIFPEGNYSYHKADSIEQLKEIFKSLGIYYISIEEKNYQKKSA